MKTLTVVFGRTITGPYDGHKCEDGTLDDRSWARLRERVVLAAMQAGDILIISDGARRNAKTGTDGEEFTLVAIDSTNATAEKVESMCDELRTIARDYGQADFALTSSECEMMSVSPEWYGA